MQGTQKCKVTIDMDLWPVRPKEMPMQIHGPQFQHTNRIGLYECAPIFINSSLRNTKLKLSW